MAELLDIRMPGSRNGPHETYRILVRAMHIARIGWKLGSLTGGGDNESCTLGEIAEEVGIDRSLSGALKR